MIIRTHPTLIAHHALLLTSISHHQLVILSLLGAQPAGMEVRLLLPIFLLHGVTLFCAVTGDNMTEEYLGDTQAVTPRPAPMQNIRTPQCDHCPNTTTEDHRTHGTTVPPTHHTPQPPSPAPSPTQYVLVGLSGPCLRMKAIFIVMLNTTNITNVIVPSPPITTVKGFCGDGHAWLELIFPGGYLYLKIVENKKHSYYFLKHIYIYIEKEGETIVEDPSLEALVTPLGSSFTSEEVELRVTPNVSLVFMDFEIQAFELEGGDPTEGDENTHIVYDWNARVDRFLNNTIRHWSVTRILPPIYTVVFLVALPLNIMAIVMFLVKMKVRKPAVVYMLNLATADVLLIGVLPFKTIYRFSGSHWMIGEGMCRFVMAAFYGNMYCSSLLMTSISVDRFLAVVYPVRSLPWRTVKRAWLVCGVIWVISLASTVPLLIQNITWAFPARDITTCLDIQEEKTYLNFYFQYYMALISLFIFLPLLITTFCYIGIIRSLSRSQFDGTHKRSRAIRLSVVVLCVFVLCFGPTNVLYIIHYVWMVEYNFPFLYIAYIVSSCISSINCCLDPLIYYFASSQCQRYVCSLLGWKKDYRPPVEQKSFRVHKDQQPERTPSSQVT